MPRITGKIAGHRSTVTLIRDLLHPKTFAAPMTRVRFNWGYHDGVAAPMRPSRTFGFGPALTITTPSDVPLQHYDRFYAIGWLYGYTAAQRGVAEPLSETAWYAAVSYGDIAP